VRINYAIFGNLEPALHAHVIPRYRNEPEAMRTQQPWAYDWTRAPAFDASAFAPLMRALRGELDAMGVLRP
jgi:diadenosine tetraphosphate (Ap4A) HIT family hydrolase